jgi:hypothetical protein
MRKSARSRAVRSQVQICRPSAFSFPFSNPVRKRRFVAILAVQEPNQARGFADRCRSDRAPMNERKPLVRRGVYNSSVSRAYTRHDSSDASRSWLEVYLLLVGVAGTGAAASTRLTSILKSLAACDLHALRE